MCACKPACRLGAYFTVETPGHDTGRRQCQLRDFGRWACGHCRCLLCVPRLASRSISKKSSCGQLRPTRSARATRALDTSGHPPTARSMWLHRKQGAAAIFLELTHSGAALGGRWHPGRDASDRLGGGPVPVLALLSVEQWSTIGSSVRAPTKIQERSISACFIGG